MHVRTVQTNASPGSHYQEDALSATHVQVAQMALLELLEWYYRGAAASQAIPARLVRFASGRVGVAASYVPAAKAVGAPPRRRAPWRWRRRRWLAVAGGRVYRLAVGTPSPAVARVPPRLRCTAGRRARGHPGIRECECQLELARNRCGRRQPMTSRLREAARCTDAIDLRCAVRACSRFRVRGGSTWVRRRNACGDRDRADVGRAPRRARSDARARWKDSTRRSRASAKHSGSSRRSWQWIASARACRPDRDRLPDAIAEYPARARARTEGSRASSRSSRSSITRSGSTRRPRSTRKRPSRCPPSSSRRA